ncbi:App1 family protein [Alloscardovia macacae]|uniref:ABC transporter ATP-binding protein n=1 Tax=Alloscardovia macacae TaxID=1160091 RepID=A0A261F600_9BIFI|nr:phosphatase domain-containing protein [Alloscardovia macacae]OZG54562.1 ABC transporter ATP-binding protein [Alloscardovia macacae]
MPNKPNKPNKQPILAQRTRTTIDRPSVREQTDRKPPLIQLTRRAITGIFGCWYAASTRAARKAGWHPRVEPYVGYGTEKFSRVICRTVYGAPGHGIRRTVSRGIRNIFMVPAPKVPVHISIDGIPVLAGKAGKVGDLSQFESFESFESLENLESFENLDALAVSEVSEINTDAQGYMDLLAKRDMTPGVHTITYAVKNRAPVTSPLFISPDGSPVGIISDVDDTIMVSQVPNVAQAAMKFLFTNPYKRSSVPGMSVFYNKISDLFPGAPFFYLSTSPWNVEGTIREVIRAHGFPQGPILLRDIDPRPKTFIPSGVQHKLEFVQQLMSDFPKMRFILLGDDGQQDPTTYARITRLYPGRILAIGIRQLTSDEKHLQQILAPTSAPDVDVPVFYGQSGVSLMSTMLPLLEKLARDERAAEFQRELQAGLAHMAERVDAADGVPGSAGVS